MPVKIRLQRKGRKARPYYHIVIADARAKRDGKFIERIGYYDPMTNPATIELDRDIALDWINKGAQPTDTVRAILRFKGVMFKKHLQRGVKKGALTQEQADKLFTEWVDAKEAKVSARREEEEAKLRAFQAKVAGSDMVFVPVKKEVPAPVVEEAPAAPAVEEAPAPMAAAAPVAADDLTKIEGIGPKMAEALTTAGIATFQALAEANADKVKELLVAANSRFASHDPTTWPKQAEMAAAGKWDELKKWQDELDGGKEK